MPAVLSGTYTLAQQYTASQNVTFVGQVTIAMAVIAEQYIAAGVAGPGLNFAKAVFNNPSGLVTTATMYRIVDDLATTTSATDSAIQTRILALWPYFSLGY